MFTSRIARSRTLTLTIALGICAVTGLSLGFSQQQDPLAEPFKGVTTKGSIESNLFPIRASKVSTAPVKDAADRFIGSLTPEQKARTTYAVDDAEWRKWNNVHRYARQGTSFKEMTDAQKERAYGLLRASLSAKGLELSRNIMKLNGHLAELMNNFEEYGEGLYFLTVMGEPSTTEPWGWQLDGHHLIINYFVLGDQVVMTPTFMGSEPTTAKTGQFAGTTVLKEEERRGIALVSTLTPAQRKVAVIDSMKVRNSIQAQAFRDNLVLDYAGIRASEFNAAQKKLLLDVVREYVGNMADGHARVRMAEVESKLDQTYFAWVGGTTPESVFYYRVQSPVILIEFDHQTPVALGGRGAPPNKEHVHTVVRTPNGNDYGKDLLRQHYEQHRHDPAHGHRY